MHSDVSSNYRSINRKLAAVYLLLLFITQIVGISVIIIFKLYTNIALFFVIGITIATIAPIVLGYIIFRRR